MTNRIHADRPPSELDLERHIESLDSQRTLNRLDETLNQLNASIRQMDTGANLNDTLKELVRRHGEDQTRIQWEFSRIQAQQMQLMQSQNAGTFQATAGAGHQLAQQQMQAQATLMQYRTPETLPDFIDPYTEAAAAGQMRNVTTDYFRRGNQLRASRAGYFSDLTSSPYFTDHRQHPGEVLSPMQYALQEQLHMRDLARNEDEQGIRQFMQYQQELHRDTQQAMLNQQVSTSLGVRGGFTQRGDFESYTLPAVSMLADDLNTSLDEAAAVVKKMRDLRVISEDIRGGAGVDILNAVHSVEDILRETGKLVRSTDLNELTAVAHQLSQIGGGDFSRGLREVRGVQTGIIGSLGDATMSMEEAFAASQRYSNMFGQNTLSAVQAGAWDYRNRNLFNQYAQGDHLDYIGGAHQGANIYSTMLMQRATGVQGMLRHAGGGHDMMRGAMGLADSMSGDPVSSFLSMPKRMFDAAREGTGQMAEINLINEVRWLQDEFGMSEDEALLAVTGGNATAVHAYREAMDARRAYAEDISSFMDAGRFVGIMGRATRHAIRRRGYRELSESEMMRGLTTGETGTGSRFAQHMGNVFVSPITGALEDLEARLPEYQRGSRGVYTAMAGEIERRTVTRDVDESFTALMAEHQVTESVHLARMLDTDAATDETEKTIEAIAGMRMQFNFGMIQRILRAGLRAYVAQGGISPSEAENLARFIARLTPDNALDLIGPHIDTSSPFYRLLLLARDPSNISLLVTNRTDAARMNLAGALLEGGMSVDALSDILPADMGWAGRQAQMLRDLSPGIAMAAGATGLAVTGATLGTGFVKGLGIAAVGTAAEYALAPGAAWLLEAGQGVSDSVRAVFGQQIDMDELTNFLTEDNASGIAQEVRMLLLYTNSLVDRTLGAGLERRMTGRERRATSLVTFAVELYTRAIDLRNKSERGEVMRKPLTPEQANAVIRDLLKSDIVRDLNNPEQWARTIIRTLNAEDSHTGKVIRVSDAIRAGTALMRDIKEESDRLPSRGRVLESMSTLVSATEGLDDLSEAFIGITSRAGVTTEVAQMFDNVTQAIGLKALNEESRTAATSILDRMREAQTTGDWKGFAASLSADELETARSGLGPEFANILETVRGLEDEGEIKTRVLTAFQTKADSAITHMENVNEEARRTVSMFMHVVDNIQHDPNASQAVHTLGKLLQGRA